MYIFGGTNGSTVSNQLYAYSFCTATHPYPPSARLAPFALSSLHVRSDAHVVPDILSR
jgi:hypothetical protein